MNMVVSLKANKKRIIAFLVLAVIVVGACILLKTGGGKEEQPPEFCGGTNEERIAFLESFGWQVDPEPCETREVMIPAEFNDVYVAYNVMQKAQGFDLKPYAGAVCTQYKYKINNYPGETEVYATLLVQGEVILGGDVACSEVGGFMHGFAADSARYGETPSKKSGSAKDKSTESSGAESGAAEEPESSCATGETNETAESGADDGEAESTAAEVLDEEDAYPTD